MKKYNKHLKGFSNEKEPEWWEEYWQNMPEFVQEDQTSYKSVIVHFENKQNVKDFAKLVSQKITLKTKSIWYPKAKIDRYIVKKYIDKDKNES